jgi:hypothetical protein
MEGIILFVLLLIGGVIALAVWLIARAVGARQSTDELKRRLGLIESGSSGCARMDFFVLFPSLSAKRR